MEGYWLKELERENRELKRANEILRQGVGLFRRGGARRPTEVMVSLVDARRGAYGVESICAHSPIAPSLYYEHEAREAEPARLPPRPQRDGLLVPKRTSRLPAVQLSG
jgi:hypothetical protein